MCLIENELRLKSMDLFLLMQRLTNKQLLLRNIDYGFDLFLIYLLTLSIFPGFLSEDVGTHSLGSWWVDLY